MKIYTDRHRKRKAILGPAGCAQSTWLASKKSDLLDIRRDSKSAKSRQTRWGWWHKTVQYTTSPQIFSFFTIQLWKKMSVGGFSKNTDRHTESVWVWMHKGLDDALVLCDGWHTYSKNESLMCSQILQVTCIDYYWSYDPIYNLPYNYTPGRGKIVLAFRRTALRNGDILALLPMILPSSLTLAWIVWVSTRQQSRWYSHC